MGIYVKGLAMPQGCEECRFGTDDCYGCRATLRVIERERDEDRPKWCPLIDVSGHGNLVDMDEFSRAMYYKAFEVDSDMQMLERLRNSAPVVIPVERSECRVSPVKPITNSDKIRQMSDDELASWIADIAMCNNCRAKNTDTAKSCKGLYDGCKGNWLDWLKQEAERNEDGKYKI